MVRRVRRLLAAGLTLASAASLADFQSGLQAFRDNAYGQAHDRWRECAVADDASCQYALGVIFDDGLGVTADAFEALRWYELAARKAHPDALMQLGFIYATGRGGIIQDPVQAWAFFSRAAAMGVAAAAQSRDRVASTLSVEERARAERLADEASIRYHIQE
jgi:TPR repeat protein